MTHYLYPKNLKAKANLWLWGMKDFLILCRNERLSYTMHSGGGVRDPARGIRLACSRRGHAMLCIPHHSQRRHDRTRLYPLCGQIFSDRSAVLRMATMIFP